MWWFLYCLRSINHAIHRPRVLSTRGSRSERWICFWLFGSTKPKILYSDSLRYLLVFWKKHLEDTSVIKNRGSFPALNLFPIIWIVPFSYLMVTPWRYVQRYRRIKPILLSDSMSTSSSGNRLVLQTWGIDHTSGIGRSCTWNGDGVFYRIDGYGTSICSEILSRLDGR